MGRRERRSQTSGESSACVKDVMNCEARAPTPVGYKIRGRQKRKARTSGPFLRFTESYCFGIGSAPKFAWTNIHLSPFFTKTRVDFARFGSVFPSLSCVRPT